MDRRRLRRAKGAQVTDPLSSLSSLSSLSLPSLSVMLLLPALLLGMPRSDEHAAIFTDAGLPVPTFLHGIREPAAKYQRSREGEFNGQAKPFFDWYYAYVRDTHTRTAWAFAYSMSRCGTSIEANCTYEGTWPGAVLMRPGRAAAGYGERFPLDAWTASTERQDARIVGPNSNLSIAATSADGNTVRLTGRMGSRDHAWRNEDGLGDQPIEWDLTVSRRAGWFGESWVESPINMGKLTGAIMWSPYGHQSTVEGTITMGGETVTLGGDKGRYRAYLDSNWGETMPRPPAGADPLHYPWGWYYATRPAADPAEDVSLICGAGRTDMRTAGVVYGKLCDIRLGEKLRLSLWAWTFEDMGNRTASWSSDGGLQSVRSFDITRNKWVDWKDQFGKAHVPMAQRLEITTEHHTISLNFSASENATSRLLFPLQDEMFSDFETLGSTASVRISERGGSATVLAEFTDEMAGLEFGYRVPTTTSI